MAAGNSTEKRREPRDLNEDYVTGRSDKNLTEAAKDAGKEALLRYNGPVTLRMVDIQIDVKNPITEYRIIFGPTG